MSTEAATAEPGVAGVAALPRRIWDNVRSGDLGSLPIVIGLAIIVGFFWSKNSNFVSATNFNNLIVQMAAVTAIAYGVVFVLLLGEIDLSIGFVSGVGGVIVAELQQAGGAFDITGGSATTALGIVAIVLAVLAGAGVGAMQGSFVAFVGVPSFVVTLAGLLAWQGFILKALGVTGVISIQNNFVNDTANYFFSHKVGWIIAAIVSALYVGGMLFGVLGRRRAGIAMRDPIMFWGKLVAIPVIAFLVVLYSNHDPGRGVPFAGVLIVALLLILTFVAKRTTFGRHIYAVGGNAEAARRAGINVRMIRLWVFMISSAMAALGGVIFAARLSSVDLNAGGGTILLDAISAAVIGGTSLFGGRGEIKSALLGALVIATIANGIDLVGYSSGTKYITTGLILLAAVTLDTLSRRRLEKVGR